ncbi:MAG: DnaJ domain-containing protein, partial [Firmicutes bacterium]|nr:DnaJ domain-containing protein [Bacillota bacterium]
MNKFTDYYKVLQVHYEADDKVIESAYKCLCKKYHPDINTAEDAADRMKDLNEAYAVLSDPKARREYHKEWFRVTNKPGTEIMSEEEYSKELASSVLDSFFRDMIVENWDAAYAKLTDVDRKNVPASDFREWKEAVAKLHKLSDYKIKYEKVFKNCDYGGLIFNEILLFSVEMTILEIASGQISHEKTKKYMAHLNDTWKLCLGYADLKPVKAKFNYFSLLKAQNMQTERLHMLNYYELLDQSKKELARCRRYGNHMTLIMLTLR